MTKVMSFLYDESGNAAAEYALILAIVGLAIVTGGIKLGNSINTSLSTAAACVTTPTTAGC